MSTLLQPQQRQEQAPRVFEGVTLGIGKGGERAEAMAKRGD